MGIFLDFDGTLGLIVERPDAARPLPHVLELLDELADRYAVVAVVSGRPGETVRHLLPAAKVEVFGLYGLEAGDRRQAPGMETVRGFVEHIAALVPGAWMEDKGASLAVHYRQTASPARAQIILGPPLRALARDRGLTVLAGKMVLELAPGAVPGKGSVIERECGVRGLRGCLYAGDDAADLDAFTALDRLREAGLTTVKVAVDSPEAPAELRERADLVVEGPAGLIPLLRSLLS